MFLSSGLLKYSNNPLKLIVEVDPEIINFSRALIPKYIRLNKPMFAPHISVVRNAIPSNMNYWGKYHNELISFKYESYAYNDELYYWLNCYSIELEDIRVELGLRPFGDVTWSPDGRHKFHTTIGNLKGNL